MGNTQSVTITHQKADKIGIQVKEEEANEHEVSGLDLTDVVTCETSVQRKSEPPPPPPPVTVKPTPLSLELNVTQATAPTMSVSPDVNEPAKDPPKQPEISRMFSTMFKNKTKPVSPASEADSAAEEPTASAVETERQKSNPPPATVVANGILAKTAVSVEAAGNHVSVTAESPESSTPAKDTTKQPEISSIFNKMFKKKTEPFPASEVNGVAEEPTISAVETQSQESNPSPEEANGAQAKAAVSAEAAGNHVSANTVSTDPNTPNKDTPKQPEVSSMFNKMFKKKTRPVSPESEANVAAEEPIVSEVKPESQKSNPAASVEANSTLAKATTISVVSAEQKISAEDSTPAKDSPKQPEISSMFNKMFKKKNETVSTVAAGELVVSVVETQSQKSEPTDIKANTQAEKLPQGEAPSPSTTEVTQDSTQPEQSSNEEPSVMNFFKTFSKVSSTKTTKEATASPDVSKEQLKKETPPAPTANVQEASKIPPPPPPAPPKMESKAEPAVKKDEAPPVQVAASAAKEPETPSKTKTKDSRFGKLFRTKALLGKMSKGATVPAKTSSASGVEEEAKPVETQVDASKTSTLEAGAKAEPPPAPKAEEKKAEKKSSPFANLLKPKVLLGQVSSKIHAAATSAAAGISLGAGGAATEPKKEAPAATTALAEAAASTKAKEEPKPAAPAAPAAASPDNKSVGSTDNSSPSTSFKLEKRNSIHLFFKNLGQKRHSDAGVQTEPVAPEKAK